MNPTEQLLRKTATRQWLAGLGNCWYRALLALAAVSLVLLLAARLLGLWIVGFVPLAVAALPVAALLLALALARRPSPRETARLLDARTGSKELFLSAISSGETPGEFQSIVVAQAEERAGQIQPATVVPWPWARGAAQALVALALLLAALRWVPQLDPFKKVEQRKKTAQQEDQLRASRQLTARRAEILTAQAQAQAAQIQAALTALDKTFKEAKPQDREANLQQLAGQQKELGELWRKVNNPELKAALEKGAQSFGRMDAAKLAEWREQLEKGDVSGLKKELAEMREQMKQLAGQTDSAEKRAQQEKLAQRLNELAEAMKQTANSPQVNEALSRALSQLDTARNGELSKEAMESAMESLQLSEEELQQLAQSLKDGAALEEALKSLQMARQLAGMGKLDGQATKGAQTMADYEDLFSKKMASLGESQPGGSGMGPGIGNGAKRPEADTAQTSFKSEKSTTALTQGRMLLEWKTKEVGESGARTEEFREAVRDVKQGVSEALQAEQVPPGYHDAIKRYFDSLPEKN